MFKVTMKKAVIVPKKGEKVEEDLGQEPMDLEDEDMEPMDEEDEDEEEMCDGVNCPHTPKHPMKQSPAKSKGGSSYSVLDTLKEETANAVAHWTNYKRYHWMLAGPRFYSLHNMFGEFADQSYATIDELAERIRMLDDDPPASLADFYHMSTVEPAVATDEDGMIREALKNVQHSIDCMRGGAQQAEKEGDPGSVDMFSKFVQIYEKQRWFLMQMLKG